MTQTHAVEFTKYHGTGNDFLVVDATDAVPDRGAFATTYCDRTAGVVDDAGERSGADGVLFVDISDRFSPSRVVMTLVQPDGSTAAMCGNGARVVAAWAHDRTGEREFMIDTLAGTRHAIVSDGGRHVEIEMGTPRFDPPEVPVEAEGPLVEVDVEGLTVTAVDTGVPHAVAFVDDVDDVDLDAVAEPVRHADVFPEGANVNVAARVDDGRDAEGAAAARGDDDPAVPTFRQRTFERGVEGETRSCGTGAVAVAAVAGRLGLVDADVVRTRPPGGELVITVPENAPARLAGSVRREFSGELLADPR